MSYDPDNIFAKILRGEIPCKKVYEDEYALAFYDIAPNAPVHVLVVPKHPYENYDAFLEKASNEEVAGYFRAVRTVANQLGVGDAYRLITNNGEKVGQSVFHFHVHILAGQAMGALLPK